MGVSSVPNRVLVTMLGYFFLLSGAVVLGIPPPLTTPANVNSLCAPSSCSAGLECRAAVDCLDPSCGVSARCVDFSQLNQPEISEDAVCKSSAYIEAVLVDLSSDKTYSAVTCAGTGSISTCPRGSVCVADENGSGSVCCMGKPDPTEKPGFCPVQIFCGGAYMEPQCSVDSECPGAQKCCTDCGGQCTDPVDVEICDKECSEGETCIQKAEPTCVPNACVGCSASQECRKRPSSPPYRYFCALKSQYNCFEDTDCGQGEVCESHFFCAAPPPIQPGPIPPAPPAPAPEPVPEPAPMPAEIEKRRKKRGADYSILNDPFCAEMRTCEPDPCQGCPAGQICKRSEVVCVTEPCKPMYECQFEDPCSSCLSGEMCVLTGQVCGTSPCQTHTCVPDNNCQGCAAGLVCQLLPTPCAPPSCDPSEPDCPQPVCEAAGCAQLMDFSCQKVLCPTGTSCQMITPPCPPGQACIQVLRPECVLNCPLKCGPNQKCELVVPPCPVPPACLPGKPCPRLACTTTPQPTCVTDPATLTCATVRCSKGKICKLIPDMCPLGKPCDPTPKPRCVDDCSQKKCPGGKQCELRQVCSEAGGCEMVAKCVRIPCPLKCKPGRKCKFVNYPCAPGENCKRGGQFQCVKQGKCPARKPKLQPTSRKCKRQSRKPRCKTDDDCRGRKKCCKSRCGFMICQRPKR